ncbi:hypothetical protein BKA80DRAFT_282324 [Phyllosticta citrichinensis]
MTFTMRVCVRVMSGSSLFCGISSLSLPLCSRFRGDEAAAPPEAIRAKACRPSPDRRTPAHSWRSTRSSECWRNTWSHPA